MQVPRHAVSRPIDPPEPGKERKAGITATYADVVPVWRIAFLICCTVGAMLSVDLLRLHIGIHTDPDYHPFCVVGKHIDCKVVAASRYAVSAGLPVALWGLIGYLFLGGLCILGLGRHRPSATWPFGMLFWMSLFCVMVSLALLVVSHYLVQSICILCMAIYGINMILFGLTTIELRRISWGPISALIWEVRNMRARWRSVSFHLSIGMVALIACWLFFPSYWKTETPPRSDRVLTGKTAEGLHWIGAQKPFPEIVEYSDYQCPFCFTSHVNVRELVNTYPEKLRLVHRHYPLQQHRFAFDYAVMATCAGEKGKFWNDNDYIFANGRRNEPITVEELAAMLAIDKGSLEDCVSSGAANRTIKADMAAGKAIPIHGTPTFVMNGKKYRGTISKSEIEKLFDSHKKTAME